MNLFNSIVENIDDEDILDKTILFSLNMKLNKESKIKYKKNLLKTFFDFVIKETKDRTTMTGENVFSDTILFLLDTELKNKHRKDLLLWACKEGNQKIIERLLDLGVSNLDNALLEASYNGHKEIVKILIDKGVSIDAQDNSEYTSLMNATVKGHTEIVKILIEAGADAFTKNDFNDIPLWMAAIKGDEEMVKLIVEAPRKNSEIGIDWLGNEESTALYVACYGNHIGIVDILLKAGADVNSQNHEDRTPLMVASSKGNKEIAEKLLENGADRDMEDFDGKNALDYANGREIIKLLYRQE